MGARRLARALLYVGVLGVVAGLSKVHAAAVAVPPYDYTESSRLSWSMAYAAALCLAAYGVGLPDLVRSRRDALVAAALATAGGAVAISLFQLVLGDALLPRFVVLGAVGVLVPWYVLCALVARDGRARAEGRDRVVVVADRGEAELLRSDLALAPERPATVAAELSVDEARSRHERRRPLVEAAVATKATVVVLDRRAQADESVVAQAAALHGAGIRVRTMTLFYEQWLAKLPVAELERVALMFDIGELHRAQYGRVKRLVDLALATVGALLLVVVFPVVVAGNVLANQGPLLYRQERVGKRGRPFTIVKFRTMVPPPDRAVLADEWTSEDDPRITRFGGVLRRTHLDELPQVWNVLRGDLAVVGPRPEQPRYVTELVAKLAFYDLRHLVRPGITGWAQVKYGYAGNEGDALEKLQYEFFYLRHQSLSLDLRVVARTLRSIVRGAGR